MANPLVQMPVDCNIAKCPVVNCNTAYSRPLQSFPMTMSTDATTFHSFFEEFLVHAESNNTDALESYRIAALSCGESERIHIDRDIPPNVDNLRSPSIPKSWIAE